MLHKLFGMLKHFNRAAGQTGQLVQPVCNDSSNVSSDAMGQMSWSHLQSRRSDKTTQRDTPKVKNSFDMSLKRLILYTMGPTIRSDKVRPPRNDWNAKFWNTTRQLVPTDKFFLGTLTTTMPDI